MKDVISLYAFGNKRFIYLFKNTQPAVHILHIDMYTMRNYIIYITGKEDLSSLLTTPRVDLNDILDLNDDVVLANWKYSQHGTRHPFINDVSSHRRLRNHHCTIEVIFLFGDVRRKDIVL
jgi:hypothetical protein